MPERHRHHRSERPHIRWRYVIASLLVLGGIGITDLVASSISPEIQSNPDNRTPMNYIFSKIQQVGNDLTSLFESTQNPSGGGN